MTSSRMNNLEPKQKVRQRASTPRSKTGLRRLKCGEEKPGCLRCTKSGWKCDGYEHLTNKSNTLARTPSPRSYLYTPSSLDLNEAERRYFQSYIDFSPPSLDNGESSQFAMTKQTMLQESHGNPCVRHVIVAIGALEKSFHTKSRWAHLRNLSASQDTHHEFALFQYEKALRGLRTSIDELERGAGARETLVSAIALSIFDFFCGNGGFATQHIHFGRKILAAYRAPRTSSQLQLQASTPTQGGGIIDENLIRMFTNLDLQTVYSAGIDSPCAYTALLPATAHLSGIQIPFNFTTPDASRHSRYLLLSTGQDLILQSLTYHFVPQSSVPAQFIQLRENMLQKLHMWLRAFEPLTCGFIDTSVHPLARPDTLRFQIVLLLIRISGILQAPESVYDGLITHFDYLLSVSRDVIAFEQATQPIQINPDFNYATESYTHEPRILPSLHLVAIKCRLPQIRNEALSHLYASRRREGIWDSILCAKVAQVLIDLEGESAHIGVNWDSGSQSSSDRWDPFATTGNGSSDGSSFRYPDPEAGMGSRNGSPYLGGAEFGTVVDSRHTSPFVGGLDSQHSSPYLDSNDLGVSLGNGLSTLGSLDSNTEHRVWGEAVARDLQNPRRATVRCRQNRGRELGGGGWVDRAVVVEWL